MAKYTTLKGFEKPNNSSDIAIRPSSQNSPKNTTVSHSLSRAKVKNVNMFNPRLTIFTISTLRAKAVYDKVVKMLELNVHASEKWLRLIGLDLFIILTWAFDPLNGRNLRSGLPADPQLEPATP